MSDVPITRWEGCYDSSWKGLITDKSFAHPAKFARGLIERIYDHCLAKGYLKRGDLVADVFGGIGTGGITAAYRGLNWIGCELEPRFVEMAQENFRLHRHGWKAVRGGEATIIQGDSRKFDESVAAIVSSPPYAETQTTVGNVGNAVYKNYGKASSLGTHDKYGASNGQIGSLKSGAVEAVISSPPFSAPNMQPRIGQGHRKDLPNGESRSGHTGDRAEGNIETLKEGTVDACISSPPYSDIAAGAGGLNTKPAKNPGQQSGRNPAAASQSGNWSKELLRYGKSDGQISQLKGGSVDGVVSSPPWESNCEGNTKASKFNGYIPDNGKDHYASPEAKKRAAEKADAMEYGSTEGQIGKENGETYWAAVSAVYRSCWNAIRPGGYIILVTKDYCSKGKRVRLSDDTCKLLEHIGFVPVERIQAMLVSETTEAGLFGDEKTKKQRKSFFRRLYEANIPEGDERRIDHEDVLVYRKP